MKESLLRTKTKQFALQIIDVCDTIDASKGRDIMVKQIIRSATSIGANLHEANYAASRADFVNKLHIALKECVETEYWIEILLGANAISATVSKELMQKCGSIRRMLVKSITTAKESGEK